MKRALTKLLVGFALRAACCLLRAQGVDADRAPVLAGLARGRPGWALRVAGDEGVIQQHQEWTRRLEEVFGAPADVPLQVAAELDGSQMAWRRSEGDTEDPALFAIASWQIELRRRMLASHGPEQGRWARLVELSYDTLGYLVVGLGWAGLNHGMGQRKDFLVIERAGRACGQE